MLSGEIFKVDFTAALFQLLISVLFWKKFPVYINKR